MVDIATNQGTISILILLEILLSGEYHEYFPLVVSKTTLALHS